MTAQEAHRAAVYVNRKCPCGMTPSMRAITFALLKDIMDKEPARLNFLAQQNNGQVPMVKFKTGRSDDSAETFVRLGEVYCCDICKPALEKTLAKLPSWVLVDFDRGPAPDKIQVGVGQ